MPDLEDFARRWAELVADLEDIRPTLERTTFDAKADITEAVRAELGDDSMSHWDRGRPIPIRAQYDIESDHTLIVRPTPRARAPMRELERRARVWTRGARTVAARTGERFAQAVHDVLARHLTGI